VLAFESEAAFDLQLPWPWFRHANLLTRQTRSCCSLMGVWEVGTAYSLEQLWSRELSTLVTLLPRCPAV